MRKYTRKCVSQHEEIHAEKCNTACGNTPNTAHFYTWNEVQKVHFLGPKSSFWGGGSTQINPGYGPNTITGTLDQNTTNTIIVTVDKTHLNFLLNAADFPKLFAMENLSYQRHGTQIGLDSDQ